MPGMISSPGPHPVAFSFGTRNSFVVLPLALPVSLEMAVVVVVCQSLVELLGMIAYLRWLSSLFSSP